MRIIHFNLIVLVTRHMLLFISFVAILTISSFQPCSAQDGTYLVSKHRTALESQNEYYDVAINSGGILYIASRNGIIRYDGRHNNIINSGGSVFDVQINDNGDIYFGGSQGMGRIIPSQKHQLSYLTTDSTSVHHVFVYSNKVYGVSDQKIYCFDQDLDSTIILQDEFAGKFERIIELDDHVYIYSENKGLLEIINNGLSSGVPESIAQKDIIYSNPNSDKSKYVIIDAFGDAFIYENNKFNPISLNNETLEDKDIVNAVWYDSDKLALGTVNDGVIMINTLNNEVIKEIGYQTGLDDNEILELLVDKNGAIVVLNPKSLALVSPHISMLNFGHYPGLEGELLTSGYLNNHLYVGTNLGLFRLQKIEDYEEIISFQRSLVRPVPNLQTDQHQKKGLFGTKKKRRNEESTTRPNTYTYEKQIEKKIISSYYAFKPVDSLITNVNQMFELGHSAIASGLSGIYLFDSTGVDKITDKPIRYSYISEDKSKIYGCTDDQILVFINRNGNWVFKDIFTDLRSRVTHIFEKNQKIYICSPDKIYKIGLDGNEIIDAQEYEVYNPFYSDLYAFENGSDVSFLGSSGVYQIKGEKIELTDAKDSGTNFILDNHNRIWRSNNTGWQVLGLGGDNGNYPVFNSFENLHNIFYNQLKKEFWIIANKESLLTFKDDIKPPGSYYAPQLDEIRSIGSKSLGIDNFKIEQDESSLSFRIVHSDLANLYNSEYRYKLKGLESTWSAWSQNNIVSFSFLPPDDYTLELEARNVFGQEYEISPINFSVLPPYWQRPWFYALEICVIILLLIISIKLKSWGFKYRLLSRLLAFLTLVIILEYLEAIMESYFAMEDSPIFSFALQVVMAIIILPFEGLLKKFVFKEKDIKLKEYLTIKDKTAKINTKKEE